MSKHNHPIDGCPICEAHVYRQEMTRCNHCHNLIWWSTPFKSWRDKYGNICNDGYKHVPESPNEEYGPAMWMLPKIGD